MVINIAPKLHTLYLNKSIIKLFLINLLRSQSVLSYVDNTTHRRNHNLGL